MGFFRTRTWNYEPIALFFVLVPCTSDVLVVRLSSYYQYVKRSLLEVATPSCKRREDKLYTEEQLRFPSTLQASILRIAAPQETRRVWKQAFHTPTSCFASIADALSLAALKRSVIVACSPEECKQFLTLCHKSVIAANRWGCRGGVILSLNFNERLAFCIVCHIIIQR